MTGTDWVAWVGDWVAWVGAVTGVAALALELVRWLREGPRLHVRASPNMKLFPDHDGRPILMVWVTNRGTAKTTLTTFAMLEFASWIARYRMRPSRNWVAMHDQNFGPPLPHELEPGQQWMGGVRVAHDTDLAKVIAAEALYVGIYHALGRPNRPVLALAKPGAKKETQE
jgi:hypothetical protein